MRKIARKTIAAIFIAALAIATSAITAFAVPRCVDYIEVENPETHTVELVEVERKCEKSDMWDDQVRYTADRLTDDEAEAFLKSIDDRIETARRNNTGYSISVIEHIQYTHLKDKWRRTHDGYTFPDGMRVCFESLPKNVTVWYNPVTEETLIVQADDPLPEEDSGYYNITSQVDACKWTEPQDPVCKTCYRHFLEQCDDVPCKVTP